MGKKFDTNKLRMDLIDPVFIGAIAEVLTHGAEKYGPNNWQTVEDGIDRYYAALLRHIVSWRMGEKLDTDSSLQHLAHVATNTMFLLWLERNKHEDVS